VNMTIRTHPFVVPYRPVYGYVVLLAMLIAMCWENALNHAAIVEGAIPEEAIRIRILANSDSAPDQAVKRHIRNAVEAELRKLSVGAMSIGEAREAIAGVLPELEALVNRELEARGFGYGAAVRLGSVPFPAKIYGNRVYPAGDYEALLITLGQGRGDNWWCVLFPPLCFADAVGAGKAETGKNGRTAATEANEPAGAGSVTDGGREAKGDSRSAAGAHVAAGDHGNGTDDVRVLPEEAGKGTDGVGALPADAGKGTDGIQVSAADARGAQDVEVRFAVWELIQRILDFFRRLFG